MIGGLALIPRPLAVTGGRGVLATSTLQGISVNDPAALPIAELFRADARRWSGIDLGESRLAVTPDRAGVRLDLLDPAVAGPPTPSPESAAATAAHSVTVDAAGILVRSGSLEGLYRGLNSVVQLLGTSDGRVPHVLIRDEARFGWRGLSLDTARSFIPVPEIKQLIEVLALYKLDVLHLHLTDNEGWRLQVPRWPLLTPGPADGSQKWYSTEDLAELTAYARERFITVIPEADLPGHTGAAIRAYPALNPAAVAELDRPFPRANLDPGSAEAWRFVDAVVSALADAAAGPYVHIGGDEAFGMDDDAHVAFVNRAIARGAEMGKTVIGWQEISRADVGPGQLVQHWIDFVEADEPSADTTEEAGAAAGLIPAAILAELGANFRKAAGDAERIAAKGPRVIMSPNGRAYLDRLQRDGSLDPAQHERRASIGLGYYPPTPLSAYLAWDPRAVTPAIPAQNVVGVEAALWTENAATAEDRGALLLPRLPAIAEVAWSAEPSDWSEYRSRLAMHGRLWDRIGIPWYAADSVVWERETPSA